MACCSWHLVRHHLHRPPKRTKDKLQNDLHRSKKGPTHLAKPLSTESYRAHCFESSIKRWSRHQRHVSAGSDPSNSPVRVRNKQRDVHARSELKTSGNFIVQAPRTASLVSVFSLP